LLHKGLSKIEGLGQYNNVTELGIIFGEVVFYPIGYPKGFNAPAF